MSALSLEQSMVRAQARLAGQRAPRADRGQSRLAPSVEAELQRLLDTLERPPILAVMQSLRQACERLQQPPPSRTSIYNAIARARPPQYQVCELPPAVQSCLLNVDGVEIGGAQLVFHAFNYGTLEALSFAAGLPWLCLLRAAEWRGFRPKSYALLRAVMAYRGI
jgi:hypothetical protein